MISTSVNCDRRCDECRLRCALPAGPPPPACWKIGQADRATFAQAQRSTNAVRHMNVQISIYIYLSIYLSVCLCVWLPAILPGGKKLVLPGHVLVPVGLLVVACRKSRSNCWAEVGLGACALHLLCKDGACDGGKPFHLPLFALLGPRRGRWICFGSSVSDSTSLSPPRRQDLFFGHGFTWMR